MKLLDKNNRQFFRFASLLLLLGGLSFFLFSYWSIRSELDEELEHTAENMIFQLNQGQQITNFFPYHEIKEIPRLSQSEPTYSTITLYENMEEEDESYRQYVLQEQIGGQSYEITIRSSLLEAEDLLVAIGVSLAVLILVLFIGLRWFNDKHAKKLWQPFHDNLSKIKAFSIQQRGPLQLSGSGITEFDELKTSVEKLTDKIQKDYRSLKEFTENASHEIQTPLSIIGGKIEVMIQQANLREEELSELSAIYEASQRLSKLNKGLLLLTKIDNQQFQVPLSIELGPVFDHQINFLAELLDDKNITIRQNLPMGMSLEADPNLMETLVKNLLENAIRYSPEGGKVDIFAEDGGTFCVSNPGLRQLPQAELLFQRFKKNSNEKNSLGLGLAIVKKICDLYDWRLKYAWKDGRHHFYIHSNAK